MMVKICGITNRPDAVAAQRAGASALGFNFFAGSPRCVTPEQAGEIGSGLPLLKVGIFVNEDPGAIRNMAERAGLDVVQLHGDEAPETIPEGLRIWKAFRVTGTWNAQVLDEFAVEAFLLDGPAPGTGEAFDWTRALHLKHRIVLAGGLDADNVADAIRRVRPWGVDACSRLESEPGRKDHTKVARFIEAALRVAA
jgi:phosphoribosylanthranilate isomerase